MTNAVDERAPETDETPDQVVQPALPDMELPDHHGHQPVGMRSKVTGAGSRITKAHEIGDVLVLVAEVRVADAGHTKTKDGLLYVEKFKVEDLFEMDSDSGRTLLSGLRQEYRLLDDARHGRRSLFPDRGPVTGRWVYQDESGYILSEDDLAQMRGDVPPSDEDLEVLEKAALVQEGVGDAQDLLQGADTGDWKAFDKLTVAQISAALAHVDDLSVIFACQQREISEKDRAGVRRALEARADELAEVAE